MTTTKTPITHHLSPITKLKVMTVVGTRPEIIRLSAYMAKRKNKPDLLGVKPI